MGFEWVRGREIETQRFEFTEVPRQQWVSSPLYHLLTTDADMYRERLFHSNAPSRFPLLNSLREEGVTDYAAFGLVLAPQTGGALIDPDSPPEGVLLSYASDGIDGFSDDDIELIRATLPSLGLALKSASNRRMAEDLLKVYLGDGAGRRVLSGELRRGSLQEIRAVVFHFDLTDFTQLAERVRGPDMIAMLNEYFSIVVE
jgi:adenylate cyclase